MCVENNLCVETDEIQATCADKEVINWTNYFYDH